VHEPAGDASGRPAGTGAPRDAGLVEAVERVVLGEGPRYDRVEVARMTGVDLERLTVLWRALGFASPSRDDEALFTSADVEAIRGLHRLLGLGVLDDQASAAVVRTMGRTFSRLAEWEVALLRPVLGPEPGEEQLTSTVAALLPLMRQLQDYVWRRHLAGAAVRELSLGGDTETTMAVGFVDIVGFTRNSRKLSGPELADLVERFEATANELVAGAGGRIIKTIGDEIMFAADDGGAAARTALELAGRRAEDDTFPEVRAGVALGPVLSRLGDVLGETVNVASRLTSLARPGTLLVNRALAEALEEAGDLVVRRVPPAHVKGYSRLESWAIRPVAP
jgi:adenylate cyclase